MISAVRELGLYALGESGKDDFSSLIEVINVKNYPFMMAVELENNEYYSFLNVSLEDMNAGGASRYLYRQGSSRGSNFSPTAILTDVDKTFPIKILGWFNSALKQKQSLSSQVLENLKKIKESLEQNQEKIMAQIKEKMQGPKQGYGLTLKIGGKYLIELDDFKQAFLQMVSAKEDSISATWKRCSICGEEKAKVAAGAPAYKFYTIDKPGMITGHFLEELSWRNYPVCQECSRAMDEGKRVTEQFLKFSFYGLPYILIPKFLSGKPSKVILAIMSGKMDKTIRLKDGAGQKLVNNEDDILDFLADEQDNLSYNFLFMRKVNSAERILLLVEDVLPSRLRALFDAKANVDKVFDKSSFHLGRVRTFFSKSDEGKRENDLDKYFLEMVDKIFKGLPVAMSFIVAHFMREIRREFNSQDGRLYKVQDAMQTVMFLAHLQMLKQREVNITETIFDPIFEKYAAQLDAPEKRGIFLLGALTKMLLNVQYKNRKAQPFLLQLMGLKMDSRSIKGLLPKVENKLNEYKSFGRGKSQVAEAVSKLFMESPANWRLSVDELNYYFVCGMNLYNEVNLILYGKKEEEVTDDDQQ